MVFSNSPGISLFPLLTWALACCLIPLRLTGALACFPHLRPSQTHQDMSPFPPSNQTYLAISLFHPYSQTHRDISLFPPSSQTHRGISLLPPSSQTYRDISPFPPSSQPYRGISLLPPSSQTYRDISSVASSQSDLPGH